MERKILHVDQNCFFASVEMKTRPELKFIPMAVGGDQQQRHGIILAKNQLAGSFGIKTAEAIWQARQKCPSLVIVPGHYDHYTYYSQKAFEMYCQYTDKKELLPEGQPSKGQPSEGQLGWNSGGFSADKVKDREGTFL